jgi:putative cardiolipin synthase
VLRALAVGGLLLVTGCASLPSQVERTESYALRDTGMTRLAVEGASLLKAHPGQNGFRLLPDGVDALLARIALADAAERSLDAQYYIWHGDLTGRHFVHALLRAADRGVRVRVLLDDIGTAADDETLLHLDAHPQVEIRLFNPVASRLFRRASTLGDFARVNRRMHNKAFIADNQAAILGGRNIGDEYFGAHAGVAFGDLDVLTMGPVVSDVSTAFDEYWNSPLSYPVTALLGRSSDATALAALRAELAAFIETQRTSPYVTRASVQLAELLAASAKDYFWGTARLLYDDPAKISRPRDDASGHLVTQFGGLASRSEKELLLISPYFVPGEKGTAWLSGLAQRGVRVTVLTNSLAATDVTGVHAGYQRYREALLEAGVQLYELKPAAPDLPARRDKTSSGSSRASLHAKTFVFDRRTVFIGSMNLDPRSLELNTEIGLVCESPRLAEELTGTLEQKLDDIAWRLERTVDASGQARIVWLEKNADGLAKRFEEPEAGAWRRFSVWFLSLLPIEPQL